MNVLGLCAGIGGIELGLHVAEPRWRDRVDISGRPSRKAYGRLNSRFVEWMLGFPVDWSRTEEVDLERWVTPCRLQLQQWLGQC